VTVFDGGSPCAAGTSGAIPYSNLQRKCWKEQGV
jgi:hypothetical protein